jgi:hypothetical protein
MQTLAHAVLGEVTVDPTGRIYWNGKLELADRDISLDLTVENAADATPEGPDRSAQDYTSESRATTALLRVPHCRRHVDCPHLAQDEATRGPSPPLVLLVYGGRKPL